MSGRLYFCLIVCVAAILLTRATGKQKVHVFKFLKSLRTKGYLRILNDLSINFRQGRKALLYVKVLNSTSNGDIIQIQRKKHYLCVSSDGNFVTMEKNPNATRCKFLEERNVIPNNNTIVRLQSVHNTSWYIGTTSQGNPIPPKDITDVNQPAVLFEDIPLTKNTGKRHKIKQDE